MVDLQQEKMEKEGLERLVEEYQQIIEVLQDESFDLKDFQQHVTSLKNCEDITRSVAGSE